MKNFCAATLTLGLTIGIWAGGPTKPKNEISLEQLRTACLNTDGKSEIPKNLEISCRDVAYRYVKLEGKPLQIVTSRIVSAGIKSDSLTVEDPSPGIKGIQDLGECPQYTQVKEEVSVTREISCKEVLAHKGSAAEYCTVLLDDVRANDPFAIVSTPTGEAFSPCAAINMR